MRESGKGQWGNSWLVIWREKYACVCILPPALQRLALCCNTAGNSRESWRVPSSPPPPFCWCVMFFSTSLPLSLSNQSFVLPFAPSLPHSLSLWASLLFCGSPSRREKEREEEDEEDEWKGCSVILLVNPWCLLAELSPVIYSCILFHLIPANLASDYQCSSFTIAKGTLYHPRIRNAIAKLLLVLKINKARYVFFFSPQKSYHLTI